MLFGSGFLANTGVIAALAPAGGVVLSDELNHASIVDGCRLARARDRRLPARRPRRARARAAHPSRARDVIVTDAVFSMDGDVAPLAGIVELARRHDARVIVDEAHATGVIGPSGRGLVAELGLEAEVDVVVGTLGKALGSLRRVRLLQRAHGRLPRQPRPDADLLHRAAAAVARRGARGAAHRARGARDRRATARATRASLREGARGCRPSRCRSCPLIVGEPDAAMALLRGGAARRRLRPGDPSAHRPRGHLAPARRRHGLASRGRPARRGTPAQRRPPRTGYGLVRGEVRAPGAERAEGAPERALGVLLVEGRRRCPARTSASIEGVSVCTSPGRSSTVRGERQRELVERGRAPRRPSPRRSWAGRSRSPRPAARGTRARPATVSATGHFTHSVP